MANCGKNKLKLFVHNLIGAIKENEPPYVIKHCSCTSCYNVQEWF